MSISVWFLCKLFELYWIFILIAAITLIILNKFNIFIKKKRVTQIISNRCTVLVFKTIFLCPMWTTWSFLYVVSIHIRSDNLSCGGRYIELHTTFHVVSVSGTGRSYKSLILHYCDVIMGAVASQITSLTIIYSTIYSVADQRKHESSASLAFVRGIHRSPVNSPHKWPVTWKMFPFDDVIMESLILLDYIYMFSY